MTRPGRKAKRPRQKPGARQLKHRRKRRAAGLCAREGCPAVTGTSYRCPKHADENRMARKIAELRQDKAA